ncbi:MAG TPA: aldehyde ferredoxin oxidoreductase family protein [Anaerolineaceae bacterium]|nr:aldehyde ferredoxin oxidoreductase family protein [Anaerolineaceae bacterium]
MFGSSGKILRVDLSSSQIDVETISDDFYRLYPGGKALAGYILLNELLPNTEPLSPENVLVIANGLLTGAPISTATRYVVSARSPLTNAYGESEAAGFWGPELKMAGYEAIVIKGRAEEPVYLWIHADGVEIRPAGHLWGKTTADAQTMIRQEHGDEKIRVLQIGIAGENLVRFSGLTNDLRHFNGRNGMGAVMGSKNLRAVAVRGNKRYQTFAHDPESLMVLGRKASKAVPDNPLSWDLQNRGTPGIVEPLNKSGMLPTRNFRQGMIENVDNIKWEAYEKQLLTARKSCYACAVRCKREVAIDGVTSPYGGPEYETLGALGPNCAITDLGAIAKANELCNAYMLDSISTGATIAFAMECFEHGLLTLQDTGGIDLRFGNTEAMLQMVEKIARREGLGDLLAEGTRRAAEKIGGDAPFFAMQVKGQELAMHEPRGKYNVGMGYAISEIGADHLVVTHDPAFVNPDSIQFKSALSLGIKNPLPARSFGDEKMEHFFILERWTSLEKVIGYCFFGPVPRAFIAVEDVVTSVNAATGWDLSIQDLLLIGERATNLARIFNLREGFSRKDDCLPERLFQGLENGALQGNALPREEFEQALTTLYTLKGWHPQTGIPTAERLNSLSLEWAIKMLPRESHEN